MMSHQLQHQHKFPSALWKRNNFWIQGMRISISTKDKIKNQNCGFWFLRLYLSIALIWPRGRLKFILPLLTRQIFLKIIQIRASFGSLLQLLLIKAWLHFLWLYIGACNCTKWLHLMHRNPKSFLFGFILFILLNFVFSIWEWTFWQPTLLAATDPEKSVSAANVLELYLYGQWVQSTAWN